MDLSRTVKIDTGWGGHIHHGEDQEAVLPLRKMMRWVLLY